MNVKVETEKLAESTMLMVMARLAMLATPILLGAIGYFGLQWLDGRFEVQAAVTTTVIRKVDNLEDEWPKLRERVVKLEINQDRGRADRQEYQRQTLERLDRVDAAILALSNSVAALNATLVEQQRRSR